MAGTFIAHVGAGLAAGAISESVGGWMSPFSRQMHASWNDLAPNLPPSPQEIFWALRTGLIKEKRAESWLAINGIQCSFYQASPTSFNRAYFGKLDQIWADVYASQAPQPQIGELQDLLNRGQIDAEKFDAIITRHGFDATVAGPWFRELAKEIPGVADLTRFAVRHVWEPDLIQYFGYEDEYRPAIEYWMGKQGFSYDARTPAEVAEKRPAYTWGQAAWWAHWILPSPGQGYEMLQRLRPTGGEMGGKRDPSGETFTERDLALLLRANDYPPFWRGKLAAISFRPIGLRQLAQLYASGLIDRAGLIESWQDLGFNKGNATKLADNVVRQRGIVLWKAQTTGARSRVITAYKGGYLSREVSATSLYILGLVDPVSIQAFQAKPLDEQQRIAFADPAVKVQLTTIDAELESGLAAKAVAAARKLYLGGRINADGAANRLAQIGIQAERRQQYLRTWEFELGPGLRELTAEKILNYFRRGFINVTIASTRLENLGWASSDVALMLAEAHRNMELDLAKQLKEVARTEHQRQQALEAIARAAKKQHDQARSELSRHSSPSDIERWLSKGLLQAADARRRLAALDWPADDVERLVAESATAYEAAIAKKLSKQQKDMAAIAKQRARDTASQLRQARALPKGLTFALIHKMLSAGVISWTDFAAWLTAEGWTPNEVADLNQLWFPAPTNGTTTTGS